MGSFEKPNWENWKAAECVEEKALWLVNSGCLHPSQTPRPRGATGLSPSRSPPVSDDAEVLEAG